MPRSNKDKEKSRDGDKSREGKSRSGKRPKKDKDGKESKDRPKSPRSRATPTVWMSIQKAFAFKACCTLCVSKDRDTMEKPRRSERSRDREKEKERRRQEKEAKKASRSPEDQDEEGQDRYEDGGESEYDGYTSRSGYTQSEYGESEYDDGQSTARSRRSGAESSRGLGKGFGKGGSKGKQKGGEAVPKIVNLADLKGQGAPSKFLSSGVDEDQGGFTARSGCESVRSYAVSEGGQSAGGQSVASTSVRKYMGCLSEQKSSKEVKQIVKNFVREMVKGREMGVLRADGALKPVTCGLSRAIDVFKIKSGDQLRKVQMKSLSRMILGASEELDDLETPLDETCSTIELDSGECISFKFAERKKAEVFTMCMQMLADGQRK